MFFVCTHDTLIYPQTAVLAFQNPTSMINKN